MSRRKNLLISTATSGLCLLFGLMPAIAHSGRTNGDGCHNNRRTGDYHCHNGGGSSGGSDSSSSDSSSPDYPSDSGSSRPSRSIYSSPPTYPSTGPSGSGASGRGIYAPGNVIDIPGLSQDRNGAGIESNPPLIPTTPASAQDWRVLSIGDGDTLRAIRGTEVQTVRLACIDAPEMAQAPYGHQSKERLRALLPPDSVITLREVDTDRYDRTVAEIFRQDENINLSLVRSGHAVAYRQYLSNCDGQRYLDAEAIARDSRAVFWSSPNPEMPWDFRRR